MIHEEILKATIADNHLSEEDIKNQYIQPNMETKGWDKKHMRLEYAYTAGRIIGAGMGALIAFQGFMNIGVTTGVLPNTGIPLPFISLGGTAMMVNYISFGIILNISMDRKIST